MECEKWDNISDEDLIAADVAEHAEFQRLSKRLSVKLQQMAQNNASNAPLRMPCRMG